MYFIAYLCVYRIVTFTLYDAALINVTVDFLPANPVARRLFAVPTFDLSSVLAKSTAALTRRR